MAIEEGPDGDFEMITNWGVRRLDDPLAEFVTSQDLAPELRVHTGAWGGVTEGERRRYWGETANDDSDDDPDDDPDFPSPSAAALLPPAEERINEMAA
jgi:hypothetical protein